MVLGPLIGIYASAIVESNFKTFNYTGTGSTQSFTTPGFQPNLVSIFSETASSASNQWPTFDSSGGVGLFLDLPQGLGRQTDAQTLTAFNATGFSVGTSATVNTNTQKYQSFSWKQSSNFLNIVSYTGTGSAHTINHTLGTAPSLMMIYETDAFNAGNQGIFWHNGFSVAGSFLNPNNSTVSVSTSSAVLNSTNPTSSVFSVGTSAITNSNTQPYIAYLFGQVSGQSNFGTYTGNGSSSGPSVSCGFQPSTVWIFKQSGAGFNMWSVYGNTSEGNLNLDMTAKTTTNFINLTSTGFTVVTTNSDFNTNAQSYCYAAWK